MFVFVARIASPPSSFRALDASRMFRAYLERNRDELRAADMDLAAFVCVTSIEALTHTAVLHRSDLLSDEAVETLVDEATRLVVEYLL